MSDNTTTVGFALTPTETGATGKKKKITSVDVGTAANLTSLKNDGGASKVLVTDTAGNKVDIGHTVLKGLGPTKQSKSQLLRIWPYSRLFRKLLSRAS